MKSILKKTIFFTQILCIVSVYAMSSISDNVYNDEFINYTLSEKVESNIMLKQKGLRVSTINGHLKLAGKLPSNTHYSELVSIASNIEGVDDIDTSDLSVLETENFMQDILISSKIKGVLVKNKLIYPNQPSPYYVNVESNNRNVYLSGRVKDKHQAEKAIKTAYSVANVKNVVSYLKIEDIRNPVEI